MTTPSSLPINPSLSPPSLFAPSSTTPCYSKPSSRSSSSSFSFKVSSFNSSRTKPIFLNCKKFDYLRVNSEKSRKRLEGLVVRDSDNSRQSNMTISEVREDEVEAPLLDPEINENNSRPRRIALFVEPSPFSWVFFFSFFVCLFVCKLDITLYLKLLESAQSWNFRAFCLTSLIFVGGVFCSGLLE